MDEKELKTNVSESTYLFALRVISNSTQARGGRVFIPEGRYTPSEVK